MIFENIHILQKEAIKGELRGNKILRLTENQSQQGRCKSNSMNDNIRVPVQDGDVRRS